jgi:type II secretory pathway pseudopilin PulG
MTLVEVIVAFALFAVMSTAVLASLVAAVQLTREDRARMVASDLAARELEITRDAFASVLRGPDTVTTNLVVNANPLPGGTAGQPLVANGVPYTVSRTAQWAAVGSAAASTCDEGTTTELAYLRVHVEVSWPELGDRPPVAMETVMTPPKGTYSTLTGHIGLKVVDALGGPVSGVTVTARTTAGATKTGVTAEDGCALLAFLTPGAWSITVSRAGYVTPSGDPTGATTASVVAGQLWRGSISYDAAATLQLDLETAAGHALPPTPAMPLVLGNSALLPSGRRIVAGTGATRTVANLWPYPSGYQVWAGQCLDNDPQYTGEDREDPIDVPAGRTTHGRVRLAPLVVRGAAGADVSAVLAPPATSDANCPTSPRPTISLGRLGADGTLATSLPYGVWDVSSVGGATGDVVLRQGEPVGEVTLS